VPIVQVSLLEGRPPEVKRALLRELTDAVVRTTGVPPASVRVLLHEVPAADWAVGGVPKEEEEA